MEQPPSIKINDTVGTILGVVTLVAGSAAFRPIFRWVTKRLDKSAADRARRATATAAANAAAIADVHTYLKDEIAVLRGQLATAQIEIGKWRTHSEQCEGRLEAVESRTAASLEAMAAKINLLEAYRRIDQDELGRLRGDRNRLESRVRDLEQELDRYRRGQG